MEKKKNIFQRAGEWGIPFGLYLGCAGTASIYADVFPPLAFVFLVMLLGIPVVVYGLQRYKFIEDDGFTEYSGLWMLGILLFICGTIISSLVIALVLQYGRPDFMYVQAERTIEMMRDMPKEQYGEMMHVLQRMIDEQLMPSAIDTVMSMFWFITFGGSVLSAITALIARRDIKPRR